MISGKAIMENNFKSLWEEIGISVDRLEMHSKR
jgi:hypothetical protein